MVKAPDPGSGITDAWVRTPQLSLLFLQIQPVAVLCSNRYGHMYIVLPMSVFNGGKYFRGGWRFGLQPRGLSENPQSIGKCYPKGVTSEIKLRNTHMYIFCVMCSVAYW